MSKIYLGAILSLCVMLALGFWRYSSVLHELGELEQSNRQLISTLESEQKQKNKRLLQQQQAAVVSSAHHEKALKILQQEKQSMQELMHHKVQKLARELKTIRQQNSRLIKGQQSVRSLNRSKEAANEQISENCAEVSVAEYILKQL